MKFIIPYNLLPTILLGTPVVNGFSTAAFTPACVRRSAPFVDGLGPLRVSIGLGPDADEAVEKTEEEKAAVEIPEIDHESFRTSRLADFDKECDDWFGSILGDGKGNLGAISEEALKRINTLPALTKQVRQYYALTCSKPK